MAMWCTCKKQGKFAYSTVWYDEPGPYPENGFNELQVHPACRRPHREYFRNVTGMLAPADARYLIGIFGRKDGINEITFELADGSKEMVEVMSTAPTAVLEMWKMLDDAMDHIIDTQERDALQLWKGRARTLAQCISLCMPKHFPDADDVAREAMLRYESGDADGNVTRKTPGLADTELAREKPTAPAHKLDPNQVNFIQKAKATMSNEDLAGMFKVPVTVIASL